MLQKQHSQFNSPCKYTEMKAGSQIFFADLSRFHSIMLDTTSRGYPLHIMAELVIVQPNGPINSLVSTANQNPLINTAAIGVECLQPVDGR